MIDDEQPRRHAPPGPNRPGAMDDWERQQLFREMVVMTLRRSPLTKRRRHELVRFAASLGISGVLAGRLVAQARNIDRTQTAPQGNLAPSGQCQASDHRFTLPSPSVAIAAGLVLIAVWAIRLLG